MSNPIKEVRNVSVHLNGSLPIEDYHQKIEGISSSGLWELYDDCPASFKFGEKEESDALHFGTASHAAMLEPELFKQQFVRDISKEDFEGEQLLTSDDAIRKWITALEIKGASTRKGQELIDFAMAAYETVKSSGIDVKPPLIFSVLQKKHIEENQGKTLVKAEDYDSIMKMRDVMFNDEYYKNLFSEAYYETSIIGELQLHGSDDWIKFKVRPDIITKDRHVPDYKTSRDVRPREFERQAFYSGYWFRQMFVCDVLAAVYGEEFYPALMAQSKKSPYIAQEYMLDDPESISIARGQYTGALLVYADCLKNDFWPTYSDGPISISIPVFAKKDLQR